MLPNGASDGNRTRILTLARLRSTTELHLRAWLLYIKYILKVKGELYEFIRRFS